MSWLDDPDGGFYCAGQADITDDDDRKGVILCGAFFLTLGGSAVFYSLQCISALQAGSKSDLPASVAWVIFGLGATLALAALAFVIREVAHWNLRAIGPGHLADAACFAGGSMLLIGCWFLYYAGIGVLVYATAGMGLLILAVAGPYSLAARTSPHTIGKTTRMEQTLIVDRSEPVAQISGAHWVVRVKRGDEPCVDLRATESAYDLCVPGGVGQVVIKGAVLVGFTQAAFRPDLRDAARTA